ncbi:MAG TPA: CoA pyrophosphatase [Candidatus Limnocylindria bacterium]|jgi:8-oxo-dGTP pyrophosphatase MutT (NUDIX family)
MDRILRAEPGWQAEIARALAVAPRPIPVDPRFLPRRPADGDAEVRLPRFDRATMPPARTAATLLLLYPGEDGELQLPLTVRNSALRAHAGEVSLPGGSAEEGDPSREATALRETHEEIGVEPASVHLLGALDDIWIPVSNFELVPFVGAADSRPPLAPQTDEVALIVELPVRELLQPGAIGEEIVHGPGWTLRVGGYRAGGQLVWGATARALAMFASVLQQLAGEI